MEEKEIKEAAERLKAEAKTTAEEAGKKAADTAVAEVKSELKRATDEIDTTTKKLAADLKTVSDQADALDMAAKRRASWGGADGEDTALKAFMDQEAAIKAVKAGTKKSVTIELDAKAAAIITGASIVGIATGASNTALPEIVTDPTRRNHIRAYMNVGQMTTASATYLQRSGTRTRGAKMTGEGELKGRSDLGFITKRLDAKKITNTFKITEETVEDIPLLMSTIQQEGVADIDFIEDDEILFGDGTGNHLEGVYTQATAFNGGGVKVEFANDYDVLRAAVAQLALSFFIPTLIVLSPVDVADMDLSKGEDGHYLVPTALFGTTLPQISGVRIAENAAIPKGEFMVGDFARGAQLFDRTGLSIRIYDQNEDDATHNLLLVVIEKRIALKVGYPKAFVKGSFATAKPLITAAP